MYDILVVDDDESVRDLVAIVLQNYFKDRAVIHLADGVTSASTIIGRQPIDLILTDYHMLDGVGSELCIYELPTILMSALVDDVTLGELFRSGKILDFLRKPFDRNTLTNSVEEALLYRENPGYFYY